MIVSLFYSISWHHDFNFWSFGIPSRPLENLSKSQFCDESRIWKIHVLIYTRVTSDQILNDFHLHMIINGLKHKIWWSSSLTPLSEVKWIMLVIAILFIKNLAVYFNIEVKLRMIHILSISFKQQMYLGTYCVLCIRKYDWLLSKVAHLKI